MTKSDRQALKFHARQALAQSESRPQRLALIHSAVTAALALVIAALSFILDQQIDGTGGLGDIGTRSMLQTLQSMLQLANMVLLPFWEMGILWAMLSIHRGHSATLGSLTKGFCHFGPIFRGKLLQAVMLMGYAVLGAYAGSFVFSLTPASAPLYDLAETYTQAQLMDYAALMADKAFMAALVWSIPFIIAGMLIAVLPAYYRMRLMDYLLLDQPEKGAFFALRESKALMKGHRRDLFKLDLSFWWFYLLEMVITLVCYGDVLLPMLGIDLGISANVAFFLFYAAALVCQLGLYAWKKPYLLTTYAAFYDATLPTETDATP